MKSKSLPKIPCFDYQRYSSQEQTGNSSIERQSADIQRALDEHPNWEHHPEWTIGSTTKNQSAYKGKNFPVLEAAADACLAGKIPNPSILMIEKMDRFTRAKVREAFKVTNRVIESGIRIYDCQDNKLYTLESLDDPVTIMSLVMKWASNSDYVDKISINVRGELKIRREKISKGEVLRVTRPRDGELKPRLDIPYWLDNDGSKFTPTNHAKTVNVVFQLCLKGLSQGAIARKFNQDKISTLSGKGFWGQGAVGRLLRDTRVIGTFQNGAESIPNYYPAAVHPDTFAKVQSKLR